MTDALNDKQREAILARFRRSAGNARGYRGRGGLSGSIEAAYVTGQTIYVNGEWP